MQLVRSAVRLYPALWPPSEDRERALITARRTPRPFDPDDLGEPPDDGRAHWEAVWRAVCAGACEPSDEGKDEDDRDALQALAATLRPLPVPARRGEHALIALLPPPPGVGPAWIAVYLRGEHGSDVIVERVAVPADTTPAIYHVYAAVLVPVEAVPFVDINPQFFIETVYDDEEGEMHEWHDAEDFAKMPTDPATYTLAEVHQYGTKIGGFPVHRAGYEPPPRDGAGAPMTYALHLTADFFDITFGDAGSLHVWVSATSDECIAATDCA